MPPPAIVPVGGLQNKMLDFMESYDALLSPVAPYVAPLHGTPFDEEKLRGAGYMQMHNLTGWPLPQISGPRA